MSENTKSDRTVQVKVLTIFRAGTPSARLQDAVQASRNRAATFRFALAEEVRLNKAAARAALRRVVLAAEEARQYEPDASIFQMGPAREGADRAAILVAANLHVGPHDRDTLEEKLLDAMEFLASPLGRAMSPSVYEQLARAYLDVDGVLESLISRERQATRPYRTQPPSLVQ